MALKKASKNITTRKSYKKDDDFTYEFNPVKDTIGGKEAEKVVWTTNSLNMAVDAISQGLPLKANPFCGKNTKLLRPDLVYKRTPEEVEDYIRCMNDPVYFGSKCYLMTPEGLQQCKLRNYQENYLKHLQNHRFSVYLAARQVGKSVVTGIYVLWKTLFNIDNNALILSKSGPAGKDLVKKVKDMYYYLPYHLKCGTLKWNQSEVSFDNGSSFKTEAFSDTAGLGSTINTLVLDEFAWCPPNDVELFYENIIPTVTTMPNSNVCIMSTQNGFNKFYHIWNGAITKKNIYAPFKTDWYEVPNFNPETREWEPRTEEWKEMMIGVLGSEEAFYYQYGTQFISSDKCLISREKISVLRDNVILYKNRDEELPHLVMPNPQYLVWDPEYDLSRLKIEHYVITVDLAEGGGGDYTIFQICEVIAKDKFKQVGYYRTNEVQLENAALDLWMMCPLLFREENYIISIEWNTYGALFYQYIMNLNEQDYRPEFKIRFNYVQEFDITSIVNYKKGSMDEIDISGRPSTRQMIPGIRMTHSNKISGCMLLKMMIENDELILGDLVTLCEFENFEDKNGNGSYAASYGHDDLCMSFVQFPLLKQTPRYKNFMDDMNVSTQFASLDNYRYNINIPNMINSSSDAFSSPLIF